MTLRFRALLHTSVVALASAYHAMSSPPSMVASTARQQRLAEPSMAAPRGAAAASYRARFREMAKTSHPDVGGDAAEFARMANAMHEEMAEAKKEHELVVSSIAVAGGAFVVGHMKAIVGVGIGAFSAAACAATLLGYGRGTDDNTLEPAAHPLLGARDPDEAMGVGLLLPQWLRKTVAKHGRRSIRAFARARKTAALTLMRGQRRAMLPCATA